MRAITTRFRSGRRGFALGLHLGGVVAHQLLGNAARRERKVGDLRHRGHLGRSAGDETLGEAGQFLWHDAALDHLDIVPPRQRHRGCAGDAGQEAIGDGRVDFTVLDEENVGAGAFGDAALPVEHQRVGEAAPFGAMLGDGADGVEA